MLEIKRRRIDVLPPIGKQKRYPRADSDGAASSRARDAEKPKKIDWKLITDLLVRSNKDAVEKPDGTI